jgi:anaerobic ribonucleoside-triphosphate reductase activating protein
MDIQLADYIPNSMTNGEGIRDVIFFSGCKHDCLGCHNKPAQDFKFGSRVSVDYIVEKVLKNKDLIDGATISGGDPFFQAPALYELLQKLKEHNINVWVYTGYYYDDIKDAFPYHFKYIDVLVDGPFLEALKDSNLKYCGSSNQSLYHFNKHGVATLIERMIMRGN